MQSGLSFAVSVTGAAVTVTPSPVTVVVAAGGSMVNVSQPTNAERSRVKPVTLLSNPTPASNPPEVSICCVQCGSQALVQVEFPPNASADLLGVRPGEPLVCRLSGRCTVVSPKQGPHLPSVQVRLPSEQIT